MYVKTKSFPPLKCYFYLTLPLQHSKSVFFSLAQAVGWVLFCYFVLFSFTNQAVSGMGNKSVAGTPKSSVLRLHCCPQ